MYVGDKFPSSVGSTGFSQLGFLLLGIIALSSLLVMATMLYLYRKLHQVRESGSMPSHKEKGRKLLVRTYFQSVLDLSRTCLYTYLHTLHTYNTHHN